MAQPEGIKTISIYGDRDWQSQVKAGAKKQKRTVSNFIRFCVDKEMEKMEMDCN